MREKLEQLVKEFPRVPGEEDEETISAWSRRRVRRMGELFSREEFLKVAQMDLQSILKNGTPIVEVPRKRFFFF